MGYIRSKRLQNWWRAASDGNYIRLCALMEAGIDSLAQYAHGTVTVGMYKGNLFFESLTDCPHSLYNPADSSMEASDGLNPHSSQGYLEVQSVEALVMAGAQQIKT